MTERSTTQTAVLEQLETGGSVSANSLADALEPKFEKRIVKMAIANLVREGAIGEHPGFEGSYVLSTDER